jgi:hypothetical protein
LEAKPGVDYVDMPTFVIIPASFTNGTIEVNILSRLNGKGHADARAFAGIAYRISADSRPVLSGLPAPLEWTEDESAQPRDQRAIQYFAYPDWKFDRLREQYPEGDYEASAKIGPDEWITLKLDIDDTRLTATVNGTQTLALRETKAAPVAGAVGLFVDMQRILHLRPQDHSTLSGNVGLSGETGLRR